MFEATVCAVLYVIYCNLEYSVCIFDVFEILGGCEMSIPLSPIRLRSAVQHGAKLPAILLPFLGDLLKEAARRINLSFVAVMNRKLTSGRFSFSPRIANLRVGAFQFLPRFDGCR